jgi:hypothetical protein
MINAPIVTPKATGRDMYKNSFSKDKNETEELLIIKKLDPIITAVEGMGAIICSRMLAKKIPSEP